MKKLLLMIVLVFGFPAMAWDSQNFESIQYFNQSGTYNKDVNYYQLNKTTSGYTDNDEEEVVLENPPKPVKKVVKEIKKNSSYVESYEEQLDKRTPMTYDQFPKNYDSSNSMMMMHGMGGFMPGMF